jgi:ribonuclease BN (tRNA processing enzyme)
LTGHVNGDEIDFSWELQVQEGGDPRATDDMFGASAPKRFIARRVPNATDRVAETAGVTIWITLGTSAGPPPDPGRSKAANVLVVDGHPWMVDCGDGAMERLVAAGFGPTQVNTAFISHLHLDHYGGLMALIALHWWLGPGDASNVLTIYGPPGTDVVVNGILQSLTFQAQMAPGKPAAGQVTRVVIVKDGSDLSVNGVRVRAVRNSHFDGSPDDSVSQSLSYRFDYKGYGIGYTGDTGPSDAVTRLVKGADVLVSEVEDKPAVVAQWTNRSYRSPEAKAEQIHHFATQHLSPQEAGAIAEGAGVRRLVFTHLTLAHGGPFTTDDAQKFINGAHETFKGEVIVAHDLDRF